MEIAEARWIVWFTVLLVAIITATYFAKMFRDMAVGQNVATEDLLSDFDRLRNEGKLNEEEFKKLKSTIRENQEAKQDNNEDPNP